MSSALDITKIQYSSFEYLTSTSNGGAICIDREYYYLSVDSSIFFHCSVPNQNNHFGGGIYYNSKYRSIICRKLCASYCSGYRGPFLFITSNTETTYEGGINDTSYHFCPESEELCYNDVIIIYYGLYSAYNINATNNKLSNIVILSFNGCKEPKTSYSNFINNTAGLLFFSTFQPFLHI